jgi:hypothetical protein
MLSKRTRGLLNECSAVLLEAHRKLCWCSSIQDIEPNICNKDIIYIGIITLDDKMPQDDI